MAYTCRNNDCTFIDMQFMHISDTTINENITEENQLVDAEAKIVSDASKLQYNFILSNVNFIEFEENNLIWKYVIVLFIIYKFSLKTMFLF